MYIGDANFLYTMKCFLCALPGNNGWKQYRIMHSRVSKCFPETLSIGMLHRWNWPLPLHHIWSCHAVYILLLSSFKRIYIQCEKLNNAFTAVWKHVGILRNLGNGYPILMLLYLLKSSWSHTSKKKKNYLVKKKTRCSSKIWVFIPKYLS